jgi:hypothetical protein
VAFRACSWGLLTAGTDGQVRGRVARSWVIGHRARWWRARSGFGVAALALRRLGAAGGHVLAVPGRCCRGCTAVGRARYTYTERDLCPMTSYEVWLSSGLCADPGFGAYSNYVRADCVHALARVPLLISLRLSLKPSAHPPSTSSRSIEAPDRSPGCSMGARSLDSVVRLLSVPTHC